MSLPGPWIGARRVRTSAIPLLALFLALSSIGMEARAQEPESETLRSAPSVQDKLDAEIQRATAALERLQDYRATQLDTLSSGDHELRNAIDRAASLKLRLPEIPSGSDVADRFFDTTVEQLIEARDRLRAALDQIDGPSSIPRFVPQVDLEALRSSLLSERLTRLDRLTEELKQAADALAPIEHDARVGRAGEWWEVVRLLNDVRIRTLDRLSAGRRARILGLSREGVQQLQRELDHLALTARVYALTRLRNARTLGQRVLDPFTLGSIAWALLKVVAVLAFFGFLRGRGPRIRESTRRVLHAFSPRVAWRRHVDTLLGAATVVGPWLLGLVLLQVVPRALGPAARWPELQLAYQLALIWVLYRLAIASIVALIVALVRRYRFEFSAVRTAKLLKSVRAVLRVAFVVAVLLTLSAPSLGRGYLYHVVFRFSLVALALVLLLVFLRWRQDITQAYLALGPRGMLRERVEATQSRWYGGFVALAALVVLAGQAVIHLTRDFLLGFDQTRRALAFVFRRRIEKQAERTGYAGPDAESQLPASLLRALDEDPLLDDRLRVDYFPGLDRLHESLAAWRETGQGGSFLLKGDLGVGRTSWLNRVEAGDLPKHFVTFEQRLDRDDLLASVLGEGLDLGAVASTDELRERLLAMPQRVVIIDRGQNLFLGRVGGYEGFESFMTLVDATAERVFWLVAFSQLAWEHIAAVHPQLAGFRREAHLGPWPEEQIRDLIRRRVEAGGVRASYDDLALDSLEGVSQHVRTEETEQAYARLLWDTSMGLPRVALQYWRRSLVPESESSVRVRLFRPPDVEALDRLGDVSLFILAAIVTHESLTIPEISVVTRYSVKLSAVHMARLEGLGATRRRGDRYWVTSFWQTSVYRLLKRRNLLSY